MAKTSEGLNNQSVSYLYPRNQDEMAHTTVYLCCDTESPDYISSLSEQLEQHQALQNFYAIALLAITNSEEYKDCEDWQYGAFLLSKSLAKEGETLIEKTANNLNN